MRGYCDYGHEAEGDVRLLPLRGEGHLCLCHTHYLQELALRRASQVWPNVEDYPSWESLQLLNGAD